MGKWLGLVFAGIVAGLLLHGFVFWSFDYASMETRDRVGALAFCSITTWIAIGVPVLFGNGDPQ